MFGKNAHNDKIPANKGVNQLHDALQILQQLLVVGNSSCVIPQHCQAEELIPSQRGEEVGIGEGGRLIRHQCGVGCIIDAVLGFAEGLQRNIGVAEVENGGNRGGPERQVC